MKDLKILKELRANSLASMKDEEYAMLEEQVAQKGIKGLSGYAKRMVEKGMRDMAYSMKKALEDVAKHGEHDQASHGSWAAGGMGGSASGTGAPKKIGQDELPDGSSKQGSIATTPGVLDKLFGKGDKV